MRSNVKSKSSPNTDLSRSLDASGEPMATERPAPPAGQDDQSDPSKRHEMSAIWPLLWLLVPLASLILYGLFSRQ